MNKNSFHEISSWNDFKQKLTSLNNKEKGDYFELLTKLYFQINPIYDFYDEVWMLSEVPQKELEYLELPAHDLGIDLIAKSGNEYHAIQCKYHSNKNKSVTFKEVSTFISLLESSNKISQGYICSTAFVTSRNFNKLKTKPINLLMSDTWQILDENFFTQVKKLLSGSRISIPLFKPREHQQKAIKQAVKHFSTNNESRGKLIFPCGSGKSLTGFWITQKLKSKSTIIAVPSLSLIRQTLEVYLREIVAKGDRVKWLCICSDKGIGENDDVVYYTENLGVPCQTDPVYIENWLRKNKDEDKIIFTTYQSGRLIADISKKLNFTFDVGIFDEAHKTVGSNKKLFSYLLFDENIFITKRIFMTATERFYTGSKDDIISMDDGKIYGETFAKMSFKEAIDMDLLTDYRVITIDIKKSEIANFIKDNNLVQLNDKWKKETEARSLASMLALRKAMKQFNIKNAVSFHSTIEKAKRNKELQQYITETYNYQPIDTYTVSGKIPTTKRNDIIQEFANSSKGLITNARCLTEGVDVPNIDCIVFADPRKSKVDIVQALGRALRKKEGKDWGYVILPIVYNDETEEIDNDSFNEILSVVRGLASNDERIVDYLKDKSENNNKKKDSDNEQFGLEVFSDYINEKELTKELQIKLWDKLARFNWRTFKEARAFARTLNLNRQSQWLQYCKSINKPKDIPSNVDKVYKNKGWKGYGDWLGTGRLATWKRAYLPYNIAKEFVHQLKIENQIEWIKFAKSEKIPLDIPASPRNVYDNKGWISWNNWLGTENLSYEDAKKFVHKLKLKNQGEWREYCKSGDCPVSIPKAPGYVYKNNGWKGYGDWLGTNNAIIKYRSYEEAKKYVHTLNLRTNKQWLEYTKKGKLPNDIPNSPHAVYEDKGWKGKGDWLGTGRIANQKKKYKSFLEARKFAQNLKLQTYNDWKTLARRGKLPKDMPNEPRSVYKNKGWVNSLDWIGRLKKTRKTKDYLSFEQAREFAHSLNFKFQSEWLKYYQTEQSEINIPKYPDSYYKNKGWYGWEDFLTKNKN